MAQSYLVDEPADIERKEGNTGAIAMTISSVFTLLGADLLFNIRDKNDRLILAKKTGSEGGITVDGQDIVISLETTDLSGKAGQYIWELLYTGADDATITIGEGNFTIRKQYSYE